MFNTSTMAHRCRRGASTPSPNPADLRLSVYTPLWSFPFGLDDFATSFHGRMSMVERNFWKYAPYGMRICAVLMLMTLIPSGLNYYLNLGWFGSYDRLVYYPSVVFGLILAHRIKFWHDEGR